MYSEIIFSTFLLKIINNQFKLKKFVKLLQISYFRNPQIWYEIFFDSLKLMVKKFTQLKKITNTFPVKNLKKFSSFQRNVQNKNRLPAVCNAKIVLQAASGSLKFF